MPGHTHTEFVFFTSAPGTQTPCSLTITLSKERGPEKTLPETLLLLVYSELLSSKTARAHGGRHGQILLRHPRASVPRTVSAPGIWPRVREAESVSACARISEESPGGACAAVAFAAAPAAFPHHLRADSPLPMGKKHRRAPSVLSLREAGRAIYKAAG